MSPTPASGETPEGCDFNMRMLRLIVIVLALFEAGWITVDGVRAFTVGGYLTPRMGPYGGKLGPWTRVVWAVGLSPRSESIVLAARRNARARPSPATPPGHRPMP